jgi:hypothetical protein
MRKWLCRNGLHSQFLRSDLLNPGATNISPLTGPPPFPAPHIIRAEIAHTLDRSADIEEEMRQLFRALAGR